MKFNATEAGIAIMQAARDLPERASAQGVVVKATNATGETATFVVRHERGVGFVMFVDGGLLSDGEERCVGGFSTCMAKLASEVEQFVLGR